MFETNYKSIIGHSEGVFRDKGSRFLAFAYYVETENECKSVLERIKKEHPKANHHCYAYRLGPYKNIFRWYDDREPSNTAGRPIYAVIQSNDLTNILIVVVRYFGGTLLGVPGLIQAYRSAAEAAIEQNTIIEKEIEEEYELQMSFEEMAEVMKIVKQHKATLTQTSTADTLTLVVKTKKTFSDHFLKALTENYLLKEKIKIKALF
ncbi:MAG: YigZ family protein [Bacteroidetes bacterium]|nr:YigZ family protein [Bacteroidota bacterium]MBX7239868.1 YigZ family protein [Bacteroidia bacterium]MCW5920094.1 YigZ family protein [Bacteroidota bacterium]HCI57356.1 YigZ family protein [Bacteroidota bacterium]HMW11114.1 YigZ family protein [Bacteroidia bacterium]